MVRGPWVLLLVVPVFAGCIEGEGDLATADDVESPRITIPGLVAHDANGSLLPSADWDALRLRVAPTGFNGGEPTIGVTSDGTIFAVGGGADIIRSTDHGRTWDIVADPVKGPKRSLDPWIWVDPLTDRVYNAPLYVVCTWAAWTDDKGRTWDFNPLTGCGPPAHDHQKLTTGPPSPGVTTSGYPDVVYYSYNSFREEGTWISTSVDGGKTYTIGQAVHPSDCHSGVAGGVAVAPDGTAYSPKPSCTGVNVAVSYDSGQTWKVTGRLNQRGVIEDLATNPDIAIDAAGNAYLVYQGGDLRMYMSVSQDRGQTWSEPVVVSPPHVEATTYSVAAAGAPGRVSIGYLGTTSDPATWPEVNPSAAPDDAVWHAWMTFSETALDPNPTFVSNQVTTDSDPAQIGCIWLRGGSVDCRNMLDFIEMVQHDGHTYLVYSDGCNKCSTAADSRARAITTVIVEEGPSLLGGLLSPLIELEPGTPSRSYGQTTSITPRA